MSKFKVGDKVKLNCAYDGYPEGSEGVVTDIVEERCGGPGYLVTVSFHGRKTNMYDFRLDLIPEPVVKTLEERTDKQLADEYRRLRREAIVIFQEMMDRGFNLYYHNRPLTLATNVEALVFKKTITETVEV